MRPVPSFRKRSPFAVGLLCGIVIVFATRAVINATAVADWLVQPLLLDDTAGHADAILVPGAGVIGDCGANHSGVRRVLLAAQLWRQGRAPYLVITGGSGPSSCPVAISMARLAVDVGVPSSNVRVETASRSTNENGEFSAPMLRGWGVRRLLLVTDRLHMRRASGVFRGLGFDVERVAVPIYEGHPDNVSMLRAGLREFTALAYYGFRGWLDSDPVRAAAILPSRGQTQMIADIHNPSGPIVLLGASYAEAWNLAAVADVPVVNRGITGQQSFELLERFERDVVAERPRAVIVWGFINDIFRAPENGVDESLARVRDSYVRMVERARAAGIVPIVATEVTTRPRHGTWLETLAAWVGALRGKEAYQDYINRHVLDTNRWLIEFADREGILVLDFQAVLSETGGRRRLAFAQDDGSHITAEGYAALTAYAQPILEGFVRAR